MKCFSVVPDKYIAETPHPELGSLEVITKPTPLLQDGIMVHCHEGRAYLPLGTVDIPVSQALINDPSTERLSASEYRITRASLADGGDDFFLVPERKWDSDDALLLLDPGRGDSASLSIPNTACGEGVCGSQPISYLNAAHILSRGVKNWRPFLGVEDIALVRLSAGASVRAERKDKRFIWFGKESVSRRLRYEFRGGQLSGH